MPYGHLITTTVMTLGVFQGHSSIASFSILTSASRGPSAIAELLVETPCSCTVSREKRIGAITVVYTQPIYCLDVQFRLVVFRPASV